MKEEEEEEEEEEDWPAHDGNFCGDVTHRDYPARAMPEVAEPIGEAVSILGKLHNAETMILQLLLVLLSVRISVQRRGL